MSENSLWLAKRNKKEEIKLPSLLSLCRVVRAVRLERGEETKWRRMVHWLEDNAYLCLHKKLSCRQLSPTLCFRSTTSSTSFVYLWLSDEAQTRRREKRARVRRGDSVIRTVGAYELINWFFVLEHSARRDHDGFIQETHTQMSHILIHVLLCWIYKSIGNYVAEMKIITLNKVHSSRIGFEELSKRNLILSFGARHRFPIKTGTSSELIYMRCSVST